MDKGSISFLKIPQEFSQNLIEGSDTFLIDSDIPLPVELPPGASSLNTEDLSWEMILSGMIQTLQTGQGAEAPLSDYESTYYRNLILIVRPNIQAELTNAALAKAKNGDYPVALDILLALDAVFPTLAQTIYNRALIYEEWAAKQADSLPPVEAEELEKNCSFYWEQALSLQPPLPLAHFYAGFHYIRHQMFGPAKEQLNVFLGLQDKGKLSEKARQIIKEIDQRDLEDDEFKAAYQAISQGREEEGIVKIESFLEKNPDVWNAWFLLAWAYRRLGKYQKAFETFTQSIELGGDNSESRNERAICAMELGNFKQAKKDLETALNMDGENTKIISNLGILALKEGKKEEALAFFKVVLEFDPNDSIALAYLEENA